jgi:hypothetical protein
MVKNSKFHWKNSSKKYVNSSKKFVEKNSSKKIRRKKFVEKIRRKKFVEINSLKKIRRKNSVEKIPDFERSPFGKMQLWIVKHFHLHKKVPVVMNQNIWKNHMFWFITTCTFLWRWKCSTIQSCIFPNWLLTKSLL